MEYNQSKFSKNVITLMTGTTIAQAIPIVISPILTRLYTPEDFGVFSLFLSITVIFGSIANARYELAIMLPQKDEDAINILALGFIINVIMSFIIFVSVLLFNDIIVLLLKNEEIKLWLYFIPLVVFFTGVFNLLTYFNNRKENYKDIATATILKSLIMAISHLSIGFIVSGATGLISGQIFSQVFANFQLSKIIIKENLLPRNLSRLKMVALGKRYKKFPIFSMTATLANTLSSQLQNILISIFYGIGTLGFYSLVQRLLGIPSMLIGNSFGQVFFREATKEKKETGKCLKSFKYTIKKLLFIGLPFFFILFLVAEDLFALLFGEEWRVAGVYAHIVIPLFFIRFVSSSVSIILMVFEKQNIELVINLILIVTSIMTVVLCSDFNEFLLILTILMSINYLIFLCYYYKLAIGK